MSSPQVRRFSFLFAALIMVVAGIALAGKAMLQLTTSDPTSRVEKVSSVDTESMASLSVITGSTSAQSTSALSFTLSSSTAATSSTFSPTTTPLPTATPKPNSIPITLTLANGLPSILLHAIDEYSLREGNIFTSTENALLYDNETGHNSPAIAHLDWNALDGSAIFTQTFVAATRFDIVDPAIAWNDLQRIWQGEALTFTTVAILSDTLPALQQVLGAPGELLEAHQTITELLASAWDDRTTLVLLPFDQLLPRFATLTLDGQNPLENSSHFDASRYPLTSVVYLHDSHNTSAPASTLFSTDEVKRTNSLMIAMPHTNRDPSKLTVVAMTGVTAMARMMGAQMDELGSVWPSAVVSAELASADLTVFSNEVAFAPDCETNANPNVLLFCSKPAYWETLQTSGVDLISLTGNHVNDWGRESLSWSLDFYAEKGVVVYGGGSNSEEALKPRIVEHNGNRLAFLGSNSVGPYQAWATDSLPGAARFDFAQAGSLIEQARTQEGATVIFYDVQYLESYNPWPLYDQRDTFNILVRYGADVVSGMQSHVPQSMEFTNGKLILYGLGNLYFDQMWGEATRQSLIAKHTIYDGRYIGTQILVTILYDYGQPHWATEEERQEILQRLFAASYW